MFSLMIFDLDGTLADTLPLIYEAFGEAVEPVLGYRLDEGEIRAHFGPPDNAIIRNLVPPEEANAAISRYVETYERRHDELVVLFPGIADLLRDAQRAGVTLAVVTGKSRNTALITLMRLGVIDAFSQIWAGDDVERQKPHPEALHNVLDALPETHPKDTVMIGDSAADVMAGKAIGMTTIGVLWGSPDHHELLAAEPDRVVKSVDELRYVLGLDAETQIGYLHS